MASSPFRSSLYRTPALPVIWCLLVLATMQVAGAQAAKTRPQPRGPRATGVIQLAPNGKAQLIPVTIMVDGKFYDASAYKADPVPFALESGVLYEAVKTGVSEGQFTVKGALQTQTAWFGEGTWVPVGTAPKKARHTEEKPNLDDNSGPPRLRKAESVKTPAEESKAGAPSSAPATPPPSEAKPQGSTADTGSQPASEKPADHAGNSAQSEDDSSSAANDQDPNRPMLHRGKTVSLAAASGKSDASKTPSATSSAKQSASSKPTSKDTHTIQLIPAVSDAHGPEPRPYAYLMKPQEEQDYRKKLLALASTEVLAKAKQMTPVMPSAGPAKRAAPKAAAKSAQPTFDEIEFHAFDLWSTNEPVFVMSAKAHLPAGAAAPTAPAATYFLTLVAKADIYLDLHKLLAEITDQNHLDEFPRLELIDAVDVDGDGRGELLFREVSEAGSAWAVYRAAADQLYPLFEGKPQSARPLPVPES